MNMKRLFILGAALALSVAACGGGSSDSPSGGASRGGSATVAVRPIDGVGKVLVDSSGRALYAADVEAGGNVKCVDACVSFWKPLTVDSGSPTATSPDIGKLAVIKRPDGGRQVTVDGKPLYTFSDDSAGQVKGIGFEDDFNGEHFTWDAVLEGGKLSSASGGDSGGGAYGY
jgi:predicted lipoprotein with Yx(FWY)xxD motif